MRTGRNWVLNYARLLVVLLSGCSSEIILHNPTTNQTTTCRATGREFLNPSAAAEACAKGYEAAGYKRVGSY